MKSPPDALPLNHTNYGQGHTVYGLAFFKGVMFKRLFISNKSEDISIPGAMSVNQFCNSVMPLCLNFIIVKKVRSFDLRSSQYFLHSAIATVAFCKAMCGGGGGGIG
jgi:hypothetical protein